MPRLLVRDVAAALVFSSECDPFTPIEGVVFAEDLGPDPSGAFRRFRLVVDCQPAGSGTDATPATS